LESTASTICFKPVAHVACEHAADLEVVEEREDVLVDRARGSRSVVLPAIVRP
jgi:hypothetical protein